MKNVFLLIALCLCVFSCKKEEVLIVSDTPIGPIYRGHFTVTNDPDETNSRSELEGKSEIHGELKIEKTKQVTLNYFKSINKVVGDVFLSKNEFTDLSFLEGLKRIEGTLTIQYNKNLSSFKGLENLEYVERLEIVGNNAILKIDPIKEVKITKSLRIEKFHETVPVFSNIESLEEVVLNYLTGTTDLSFLLNLTKVSNAIIISECPRIISLNGLQNLKEVGAFESRDQIGLTDISVLKNLEKADAIWFYRNSKLIDYCPLKNILSGNPEIIFTAVDGSLKIWAIDIINNCP